MRRSIMFIAITLALLFAAATSMAAPGDTLRSIPYAANCPQGLTFDGTHLWCVDRLDDMIYKIDPATGTVDGCLPAPGYLPRGLTWDGKYLWCVDAEEERIYAIDPTTELVARTIYCPVSTPNGLAWDGSYLWIADDKDDKLHQLDTYDGTTIVTLSAPTNTPVGLTYDGTYLWVSDRNKNEIYAVTPDRGEVVLTLPAPGPHAWGLAWDGKTLWNVDYETDRIYQLITDGDEFYVRREEKTEDVNFFHQVRNHGPDSIKTLDVYLAVPQNQHGQELLTPVQFTPEPTEILSDQWGQEVARFRFTNLGAAEAATVSMAASAKLYKVQYFVRPEKVGTLDQIPKDIKQKYLADDVKFDMKNDVIQKALAESVGDEANPYWMAQGIYRYIHDHMEYELAGGWNVAPAVLERGNGSCSEYSFVFISLCRAAGIPARYVGAVVIRGDDASWDDVFHRWCEIYLPGFGWLPVDPSRGDAKWPAQRANSFGYLNNSFLVTTVGGGGSEYLEWGYNANERWTSKGKCKVAVEAFGEWTPRGENQKLSAVSETGGICR